MKQKTSNSEDAIGSAGKQARKTEEQCREGEENQKSKATDGRQGQAREKKERKMVNKQTVQSQAGKDEY